LFFSKYIDAYKAEGIDIWGLTVENEPLGNGNNWESMHYTPEEMTVFVQNHLGPKLEADGKGQLKILGYDQNREHLKEWVDVMYRDEASSKYYAGTAIHWYASTFDVFPDALQYAHNKSPGKHLIQSEARKPPIGAGTGRRRRISICTQNTPQSTVMQATSSAA
jgi:glucosylceramidase